MNELMEETFEACVVQVLTVVRSSGLPAGCRSAGLVEALALSIVQDFPDDVRFRAVQAITAQLSIYVEVLRSRERMRAS
jgi:hypothetical protein